MQGGLVTGESFISTLMGKNCKNSEHKITCIVAGLFVLLWIAAGIAGFITSIVCMSKNRDAKDRYQNPLALFLSLVLGPFYWIYYTANKKYCTQ